MPRLGSLLRDHSGFALTTLLGVAAASGVLLVLATPPEGAEPGRLVAWTAGLHRWSSRLLLAGAVVHALLRTRVGGVIRPDAYLLGAGLFAVLLVEHLGGAALAVGGTSRLAQVFSGRAVHYAALPVVAGALAVVHTARAQGGRWSREYAPRPVAAINLGVSAAVAAAALAFLPPDGSAWPDRGFLRLEEWATVLASFLAAVALAALTAAHPWLAPRRGWDRTSPWVALAFLAAATFA